MDTELKRFVERAADPRLISGIYNYCHRRCDRCPFTDRCLTFQQMREDDSQQPGLDVAARLGQNLVRTVDLVQMWCAREGVDFDKLRDEAASEQMGAQQDKIKNADAREPLQEQAHAYASAAFELVSALERLAPFNEWSPVVLAALETIGWYAGMVPAKVHQALAGFAKRNSRGLDEDAVQNDWNGSAKVARLAVAESQRAWDTLLLVGNAPSDARLRGTRELLDSIDRSLAERFPLAMDFIRPGFDEPEIAAGGLSRLACFEPRRRSTPRGLRSWLHRIAGAWQRRS